MCVLYNPYFNVTRTQNKQPAQTSAKQLIPPHDVTPIVEYVQYIVIKRHISVNLVTLLLWSLDEQRWKSLWNLIRHQDLILVSLNNDWFFQKICLKSLTFRVISQTHRPVDTSFHGRGDKADWDYPNAWLIIPGSLSHFSIFPVACCMRTEGDGDWERGGCVPVQMASL